MSTVDLFGKFLPDEAVNNDTHSICLVNKLNNINFHFCETCFNQYKLHMLFPKHPTCSVTELSTKELTDVEKEEVTI